MFFISCIFFILKNSRKTFCREEYQLWEHQNWCSLFLKTVPRTVFKITIQADLYCLFFASKQITNLLRVPKRWLRKRPLLLFFSKKYLLLSSNFWTLQTLKLMLSGFTYIDEFSPSGYWAARLKLIGLFWGFQILKQNRSIEQNCVNHKERMVLFYFFSRQ